MNEFAIPDNLEYIIGKSKETLYDDFLYMHSVFLYQEINSIQAQILFKLGQESSIS